MATSRSEAGPASHVFAQRRDPAVTPPAPPFRRVLVANRGEIAVRIIRACHELGMEAVAVYSDADAGALHVQRADRAVRIGPPPPTESYLRIDAIVEAALANRVEAIHPGYGFLSERAAFARAVEDAGLVFVGPPSAVIEALGDKVRARELARSVGVEGVPGTREPIAVDRPDGLDAIMAEAGADRLPVAGQGRRRRRRTGDAPGRQPIRAARRAGRRIGRGGLGVWRWCRLPGARDPTRASHRGPAAGRCDGLDRRDRGTRLLAPATPPEAHRGGAGAGTDDGRATPPARPGGPVGDGRRSPERGDRGVPAGRRRGLPLPRGQHPAPGRARGDRAGRRHRHRPRAVPAGRGRAALGRGADRCRACRRAVESRHRGPAGGRGPGP